MVNTTAATKTMTPKWTLLEAARGGEMGLDGWQMNNEKNALGCHEKAARRPIVLRRLIVLEHARAYSAYCRNVIDGRNGNSDACWIATARAAREASSEENRGGE